MGHRTPPRVIIQHHKSWWEDLYVIPRCCRGHIAPHHQDHPDLVGASKLPSRFSRYSIPSAIGPTLHSNRDTVHHNVQQQGWTPPGITGTVPVTPQPVGITLSTLHRSLHTDHSASRRAPVEIQYGALPNLYQSGYTSILPGLSIPTNNIVGILFNHN